MADTELEMIDQPKHYAAFDAPDLAPVLVTEHTPSGWRGLTEDGEILNVNAHVNGAPGAEVYSLGINQAAIPDSISIARGGEVIGYRKVPASTSHGVIDAYARHLTAATTLFRANEPTQAKEEIDLAIAYAPTVLARYHRALIMLTLGHWHEGFDEFAYCEQTSPLFMRPQYHAAVTAGLEPWRGQDIQGQKLLLIHDHGFGDSIMMLRYVPVLKAMGADVIVQCPQELDGLVQQHAPTVRDLPAADYVCSMLMLMQILQEFPGEWTGPYLRVDPTLVEKWRSVIDMSEREKNIGIAWSVGKMRDGDYPRTCPVEKFYDHLAEEAALWSVQQRAGDECQFTDFADCAALMSLMDEIVTVDTAAAHLAGAIGHPKITLLLSHWSSWRWEMPLYPNVRICRQDRAGDWESAFARR